MSFQLDLASQIKWDLERLKVEVLEFSEEELWIKRPGIHNPAGNLALHICGNLRHFVGAVIGDSSYTRDRDGEFSKSNIAKVELLDEIERTEKDVSKALHEMDPALLQEHYPIDVFGEPMTYAKFLTRLIGHLNYHLGQINYFRRIEDRSM